MKATDAARTRPRATATARRALGSSAARVRAAPPAAQTAAVARITTAHRAATVRAAAAGARPGGWKVPTAARANSHALGLANWKAAPPRSPSGRATTGRSTLRLQAILQA